MDKKSVFISVLMITYNSSKFLRDAIDSVLALDYDNFELVISDDNSKDNSWEIINSYKDPRIVRSRNPQNLGEYSNRNKAISLATGDYVIFIDGDDIIYDHALLYMSRFAAKYPDCAMVIARQWDERVIYPVKISPENFYKFEYLDKGMAGCSFVNILFKRLPLIEVGGFDTKIKMGDIHIQYKLAMKYPSIVTTDGIAWWRRTAGQASESLIKDQFNFFADINNIHLPFLNADIPAITPQEKENAISNIYGNYIRFLIRQALRLKINRVLQLLKKHPIPSGYFKYAFTPPIRGYFNKYSGNDPLRIN